MTDPKKDTGTIATQAQKELIASFLLSFLLRYKVLLSLAQYY